MPRGGVTDRVQRVEYAWYQMPHDNGCAAERGADSAARCPYYLFRQ
jgi:hypothetical protein